MVTTKGTAIAAPQIYGSDPIEQAFAGGLVKADAGESGALYTLMSAARDRRDLAQGNYMTGLREANMMAAALEQQGNRAKLMEAALQHGPKWTEQGFLPGDIPQVGQLFTDPTGEGATIPPNLQRDLLRAKIAEKLADAQKARSGGGGKEPQYEIEYIQNPDGSTSIVSSKVKGNLSQRGTIDKGIQQGSTDARNARGNPDIPTDAPPFWQRGQSEATSEAKRVWERNNPGKTFPGGVGSRNQ